MAIFDELDELLGKEITSKLTPELRTKLQFGEELASYYNGDTNEQPVAPARVAARASETTGGLADLDAIGKLLDTRLGTFKETVQTTVNEAIAARGQEVFNNATAAATNVMTGILRSSAKHRTNFGEELDADALSAFATEEQKKGRKFSSVDEAYEAYAAPKLLDKTVSDRVREELKNRNSQSVPGVTPSSTVSPVIMMARKRSEGGEGHGSAVSQAAARLREMEQRRQA